MKLYGEIQCTIDENHPDIKYVKDWTKDKVFKFHDEYTFDESCGWTKEDAIAHIKSDLRLVAGGGYNSEHIHNVKFKIESI